jgi:predicted TIM-barrel fold metal-dependent hydrolase
MELDRRTFAKLLIAGGSLALGGCTDRSRYTQEEIDQLVTHRREEAERSGKGPHGVHRYRGYRGLSELPWFELDDRGRLRCAVRDFPPIFDIHQHLGMWLLLAPEVDLQAHTPRVRHFLDLDEEEPGSELDLDVYINANFTPAHLRTLRRTVLAQFTWGSEAASTQTIPNLIDEMDATGVERSLILPIAFDLPFGDNLTERYMEEIAKPNARDRLVPAASVHPRDPERLEKLRRYVEGGARAVKLHPTAQRFYPDAPEAMEIYEECERLGVPVVFHGGRAGIEPEYSQQFALMRYYEPGIARFPNVQFVLGHSGARDVADAIPLAQRHENTWLDLHGQSLTMLDEIIRRVGSDRLLFGTDWPFYHLAATLAKVLIVTERRPALREAILRGNALRLLGLA